MQTAATEHPDLVLLDLGLPGLSGIGVIEALRGWSTVPIIVLTARDDEHSKVIALDAGADDYITKPFGMAELLARIRAALRRGPEPGSERAEVTTRWLRLDLAGHRAFVGEAPRPRGPPHRYRMADRRLSRPQRRAADHAPPADHGGLGSDLLPQSQSAARAHDQHPAQARAATRGADPLHHRQRSRLPLRERRSSRPTNAVPRWLGRRRRGQRQRHRQTTARRVVERERAVHRVDETLGDREPEPDAVRPSGRRAAGTAARPSTDRRRPRLGRGR